MKKIVLLCPFIMLLLVSCYEYDADEFSGKILPRVTGYSTGVTNDWLYFNLRTGEMFNATAPNQQIKEGEQLTRTDWDFAVCGYHFRTNGGTSGPGEGGACDLGYANYDKWQTASQIPSDVQFVVDDSIYITYSQADWYRYLGKHNLNFDENPWFDPNSGIRQTRSSGNPLLDKAITLSGPPMEYTPSQHTYCIRTADGKHYYKLMVMSWYNINSAIDDSGGQMSYYLDELK